MPHIHLFHGSYLSILDLSSTPCLTFIFFMEVISIQITPVKSKTLALSSIPIPACLLLCLRAILFLQRTCQQLVTAPVNTESLTEVAGGELVGSILSRYSRDSLARFTIKIIDCSFIFNG